MFKKGLLNGGESMGIYDMKENARTISLKNIEQDPGPYCMSFGFNLQALIRSIREYGLINTPIVTEKGQGRVDVVAGYRRVLALQALKWESVPCRDISGSGRSTLEHLLFNLYDNLVTRQFNEVEKGMILNRLIPHVPKEEILGHYMPLLGLASHESTLQTCMGLEKIDHRIKVALVEKRISLRAVKPLLDMDEASRSALFGFILQIKFNFNQQLQFIDYITDISIREKTAISHILKGREICQLRDDEKLNRPQKAKSILGLLRSRRFPSLSQSERAFQKKVFSLGLPGGVSIEHPPFFEKAQYRLEVLFKDGRELKEKIHVLSKLKGLKGVGDPWQGDV
jgi:hypothetical protein